MDTGRYPIVKTLQEANKAVSKLKAKKIALKFPNVGDPKIKKMSLSIFS